MRRNETSDWHIEHSAVAKKLFYYQYIILPSLFCLVLGLWLSGTPGAFFPNRLLMVGLTYLVGHVGIFVGAHRCYAHNQCKPNAAGHLLFFFLTTWAAQGPIASWAFIHRIHHRFCEQQLDFHSPLPPNDFFWAQGTWFVLPSEHMTSDEHGWNLVIPDLVHGKELPSAAMDPLGHVKAHALMLLSFVAIHLMLTWKRLGRNAALVSCLCATTYYFMMPAAFSMQITMLVNSAVHLWGDEPFEDGMSPACGAKNNGFLFFPMMGENWHNNHHAAPGSATTWVEWYQIDFQYISMRLLELVGLVREVQLQPPSHTRSDYEPLSFFSVLISWTAMALLVGAPFLISWKSRSWTRAPRYSKSPKSPQ